MIIREQGGSAVDTTNREAQTSSPTGARSEPVAASGDEPVPVNVSNPLLVPYRTGSYLIADEGGTENFRSAMNLTDHRYPASGSHQLDEEVFARVLAVNVVKPHAPKRIYLVDLREETHGFLDGSAVSWYADNDFANVGQSLSWIQADERLRLQLLQGQKAKLFSLDMHPADNREQQRVAPTSYTEVTAAQAATEQQIAGVLAKKLNVPVVYRRIPVTDHCAPGTEALERLRTLWREASAQAGSWVHFHCHGGDGRTTTFLALYDMLSWKQSGDPLPPVEEFACRQCLLFKYCINPAGCNCGKCKPSEMAPWKLQLAKARWQTLEQFRLEPLAGSGTGDQ